jgi:hypothetical protein
MPVGVSITPPIAGNDGYWHNMLIIVEDPSLSFDIGRKFIHPQQQKIIKNAAKEAFKRFIKSNIPSFLNGKIPTGINFNRANILKELMNKKDIEYRGTHFVKTPEDQEASVSAIFYELVGAGYFPNYLFLSSGYKQVYDLYAEVVNTNHFITIEFKSKLNHILKDLGSSKGFEQVDCIVCWNVDLEDKQMLSDHNFEINEINEQTIITGLEDFPLATHELLLPNVIKPIFIIDLKKILLAIESNILTPTFKK